ncbi:glycoside hydrolase family 125 protein [Streptomyces sp. NPDC059697]|uniref:glycoside hydrolase family 125 protein n=1 Tax=Streptomyces sp. NPDC059697 TaxID=3346912 RepID=UPI0036B58351
MSDANSSYFRGRFASGVGSAHTPDEHVWPLAVAVAGLTGDENDAARALETLATTTAGTGLMHESFHVDDPGRFTRDWFGWANAMFCELALDLCGAAYATSFPGTRASRLPPRASPEKRPARPAGSRPCPSATRRRGTTGAIRQPALEKDALRNGATVVPLHSRSRITPQSSPP